MLSAGGGDDPRRPSVSPRQDRPQVVERRVRRRRRLVGRDERPDVRLGQALETPPDLGQRQMLGL